MEALNIVSLSHEENIPNDLLTLEQARERICKLLVRAELNAWDIGDLLNAVERRGLSRTKGYGKTRKWLEAEVPPSLGKMSTLHKYANVAAHYSKEQVELWGIAKLYCLIAHDGQTDGQPVATDPADRDIQIHQEDGSTVVKKFRDCTCRDFQQSAQRRKKGRKGPDQVRPRASKEVPVRSLRKSLAVLGFGTLLIVGGELLPTTFMSGWLFLLGMALVLGSVGALLRHWRRWADRLLSAVKEGKAMDFLREHVAKVRRLAEKVAVGIHRQVKKKDPTASGETTNTQEAPPPIEKKAA